MWLNPYLNHHHKFQLERFLIQRWAFAKDLNGNKNAGVVHNYNFSQISIKDLDKKNNNTYLDRR